MQVTSFCCRKSRFHLLQLYTCRIVREHVLVKCVCEYHRGRVLREAIPCAPDKKRCNPHGCVTVEVEGDVDVASARRDHLKGCSSVKSVACVQAWCRCPRWIHDSGRHEDLSCLDLTLRRKPT